MIRALPESWKKHFYPTRVENPLIVENPRKGKKHRKSKKHLKGEDDFEDQSPFAVGNPFEFDKHSKHGKLSGNDSPTESPSSSTRSSGATLVEEPGEKTETPVAQ